MRTQSLHPDRALARVEIMASCRPAFVPSTDLGESSGFMTAGDIETTMAAKRKNSLELHQKQP